MIAVPELLIGSRRDAHSMRGNIAVYERLTSFAICVRIANQHRLRVRNEGAIYPIFLNEIETGRAG